MPSQTNEAPAHAEAEQRTGRKKTEHKSNVAAGCARGSLTVKCTTCTNHAAAKDGERHGRAGCDDAPGDEETTQVEEVVLDRVQARREPVPNHAEREQAVGSDQAASCCLHEVGLVA